MIVIASYYALFAVMGGSIQVLMLESMVIVAFLGASIADFKRSLWVVVAALRLLLPGRLCAPHAVSRSMGSKGGDSHAANDVDKHRHHEVLVELEA